MDKLLLRPAEAADMLGIGRSKMYAMLASGEIPSLQIGKSIRVPVDALRQWVAAQSSEREASGVKGDHLPPGSR